MPISAGSQLSPPVFQTDEKLHRRAIANWATVVQPKIYDKIAATDIPDVDPNGSADSTTALSAANTRASSKTLTFTPGTYRVEGSLTISANVEFEHGAKLFVGTSGSVTINGHITAPYRSQIFDWSGTGAISIGADRWASVRWFGANPVAGVDNSSAFQKTVDSLGLGVVFVSAGNYDINAPVVSSTDRLGFQGEGPNSTILIKHGLGQHVLSFIPAALTAGPQLFDISVTDLAFRTSAGAVHTDGAFIRFEGCSRIKVKNVFMGDPFYGILLRSSNNAAFIDIDSVHGTGAFQGEAHYQFDENPAVTQREPANINLTNVRGRGPSFQYETNYGCLIKAADGIWATGCYFGSNALADVLIQPNSTNTQVTGIKFSNCWMDPTGSAGGGVIIQGATSAIYGLINFTNNHIQGGADGLTGIRVTPGTAPATTIIALNFNSNIIGSWRNQGILISGNGTAGATVRGMSINNNTCFHNGISAIPMIVVAGSKHFTINNNTAGYNLVGSAASSATFGIAIANGCDEFTVAYNVLTGNAGGISDGTTAVNKQVIGNIV